MGVSFKRGASTHRFSSRDISSRRSKNSRSGQRVHFEGYAARFVKATPWQANLPEADQPVAGLRDHPGPSRRSLTAGMILPHRQPAGRHVNGQLVFQFIRSHGRERTDVNSDCDTEWMDDFDDAYVHAEVVSKRRRQERSTASHGRAEWHKTAAALAKAPVKSPGPPVGVWPGTRQEYAGMAYDRSHYRFVDGDGLVQFTPTRQADAGAKRCWADVV